MFPDPLFGEIAEFSWQQSRMLKCRMSGYCYLCSKVRALEGVSPKLKEKVQGIDILIFHQRTQIVSAINETTKVYLELQCFTWQLYALLLYH